MKAEVGEGDPAMSGWGGEHRGPDTRWSFQTGLGSALAVKRGQSVMESGQDASEAPARR